MISRRLTFSLFIASWLLVACAPAATVNRGILEGHVSFTGPPALAGRPTPTVAPQFYEQHSLIIYRSDGSTLVTNVLLDARANYSLSLDPGVYVVKWRKRVDEATTDLPKTITIESGKTTRLDVNITTGNP